MDTPRDVSTASGAGWVPTAVAEVEHDGSAPTKTEAIPGVQPANAPLTQDLRGRVESEFIQALPDTRFIARVAQRLELPAIITMLAQSLCKCDGIICVIWPGNNTYCRQFVVCIAMPRVPCTVQFSGGSRLLVMEVWTKKLLFISKCIHQRTLRRSSFNIWPGLHTSLPSLEFTRKHSRQTDANGHTRTKRHTRTHRQLRLIFRLVRCSITDIEQVLFPRQTAVFQYVSCVGILMRRIGRTILRSKMQPMLTHCLVCE